MLLKKLTLPKYYVAATFTLLCSDNESDRMQQEWVSQARKDLEDWDRNRLEQLEKTKESNRYHALRIE